MITLSRTRLFVWVVAGVLALVPGLAAAQTTGSISGTVVDASKAVVPGVTLTVTNLNTGLERVHVSDEQGRYRALNLPPGLYRLAASLQGFGTVIRDQLTVELNRDLLVNIEMAVGNLAEQVTVAGETAAVSIGSTTTGGVVTTQQIAELPLNGRNFMQLATLQPGVITSRASAADQTGGFGEVQLSIGGARPEQTGYLMDGTNIADVSDRAPSSMAGVMLGVDSVQEFSVQTHGYAAEHGRAAGGVMSTVTKSGSNKFTGSVFEFHRNDALDERGYFTADVPLPKFQRDQYGGTLGGPILKNHLFFFGAFEGLRERNAVARRGRFPNALAHQGFVPNAAGQLVNVGINPLAKPYLDFFYSEIPTGQDFGDGTAEIVHAYQDPTDNYLGVAKFDYTLPKGGTIMVRWSRDTSEYLQSDAHPMFYQESSTLARYFTVQHQHVFGSALANTLRFASNRSNRFSDTLTNVEVPGSLFWSEDPHWGALSITNVTTAGSTATIPVEYDQTIYQLSDTLTWHKGGHVMKAGFDLQKYHFDGYSFSRYGGLYEFRSLTEFFTLNRGNGAVADRYTGNLPGTDTFREMRQDYVALFVQDDWRATDDLTLNYGLRYDFVTTPKELNGKFAGLLDLDDLNRLQDGVTPGTPLFDNPSKNSFAPRLGLAWNPFGDQKSTIKSGYGLFYQPLTPSFYRGTAFRVYPYFAGIDIRQPTVFGPANIEFLKQGVNASTIQKRSEFIFFDAEQPLMQQWHVNFERDLGRNMVAEIGYLGSKGHNLPFYGDPNTTPSEYGPDGVKRLVPGATLRYPSWGRVRTRINIARSTFHGMTAGFNKRFSDGWQFQASYSLGESWDNWSAGQIGGADFTNSAGGATDWWDPEYEWGPSSYDIRHTIVLNGTYEVPFGRNRGGFVGALIKGWQVNGLFQWASGLPFTPFVSGDQVGDGQADTGMHKANVNGPVTYPNTEINPETRRVLWFDPSVFSRPPAGVFGNARRNSLRGPSLKMADLSLFKNFRFSRFQGQFRLEAFNAFNWVNLGSPNTTIFANNGTRNATAGTIASTATAARQVQLGIKFMF